MRRTSVEWKEFLREVFLKIQSLMGKTEDEKCLDCECYFGLLFYLKKELTMIDDESINKMFEEISHATESNEDAQIHACLGCDPCPPAEWTTELIKKFES
jgi:hypothetical protein